MRHRYCYLSGVPGICHGLDSHPSGKLAIQLQNQKLFLSSPWTVLAMGRFTKHPLLVTLILVLCLSCTPRNGKNGPRGDAEGYLGVVIANYDNVRARCNFQMPGPNLFQTVCTAVAIDNEGNEMVATTVASGVQLNWLSPQQVLGAALQSQSCTTARGGLSQVCVLGLSEDLPTKILFQLHVVDTLKAREKTESDSLLLPYSATSYGVVPQLLAYQPMSNSILTSTLNSSDGLHPAISPMGFETIGMDPLTSLMGSPNSVCLMGEKVS